MFWSGIVKDITIGCYTSRWYARVPVSGVRSAEFYGASSVFAWGHRTLHMRSSIPPACLIQMDEEVDEEIKCKGNAGKSLLVLVVWKFATLTCT